MIDRDQLTEALDSPTANPIMGRTPHLEAIVQAARLLLDFPTDEQVEAAFHHTRQLNFWEGWNDPVWTDVEIREITRAALEAVRQTMIGDC
jgi:hypothetical protein